MLGHELGRPGCEFVDFATLASVVRPLLSGGVIDSPGAAGPAPAAIAPGEGLIVQRHLPIYAVDAVVRRSPALQSTVLADEPALALHPEDAIALGVGSSGKVIAAGREYSCEASVAVPRGVLYVRSGSADTAALPLTGERLTLSRACHG